MTLWPNEIKHSKLTIWNGPDVIDDCKKELYKEYSFFLKIFLSLYHNAVIPVQYYLYPLSCWDPSSVCPAESVGHHSGALKCKKWPERERSVSFSPRTPFCATVKSQKQTQAFHAFIELQYRAKSWWLSAPSQQLDSMSQTPTSEVMKRISHRFKDFLYKNFKKMRIGKRIVFVDTVRKPWRLPRSNKSNKRVDCFFDPQQKKTPQV